MRVYEFMSSKIDYIESENTVYDLIERMVDRRIRSLVVRFKDEKGGHGVVTARDVVFRVLARGLNPNEVKVAEIASRPIVCVPKETNLEEAAAIMEEANITRIYVCEGDRLVGLVSLLDAMAAALIMRARGDHVS